MRDYPFRNKALRLHDGGWPEDRDVDAIVASGDCFITLASNLDAFNTVLVEKGYGEQPELEKTVRQLLYLQHHYAVVKRSV